MTKTEVYERAYEACIKEWYVYDQRVKNLEANGCSCGYLKNQRDAWDEVLKELALMKDEEEDARERR